MARVEERVYEFKARRHPINVHDSDAAIYAPSPTGRGSG